jgi:hypothetical protein
MEMIFLLFALSILRVVVQAGLAYSAMRRFNNVKLGGKIGHPGFFIEASGKKN